MPKLSIIIPVYNVEEYLSKCIDSILTQSFKDFELLLIDDGSTDGSSKICDEYASLDSRIRTYHQSNSGQSHARNFGISVAKGQYIGFVDSDDWLAQDMYENLMKIVEHYNCDIAEVGYYLTTTDVTINQKNEKIQVLKGENLLHDFLYNGMKKRVSSYPVWNKVYKKEMFKNTLFSNVSLCEDYLINFELFQKANMLVRSSLIGYFYFQRDNSTIHGPLCLKDFKLIINCKRVRDIAVESKLDKSLIELTESKLSRVYFSLVAKGLRYGYKQEVPLELINNLHIDLRKNYRVLMRSPMPINRKVITSIILLLNKLGLLKMKEK